MDLFETVLLILLVLIAVALGALILIQQSKGADIGAAFGSGAANTLFGSSGATSFVVKFTAVLAIGFFAITFGLAYTAKERAASLTGFQAGDLSDLVEEGGGVNQNESGETDSAEGGDDTDGLPLEGDELPTFDSDTQTNEGESETDDESLKLPEI